MQACARCVVVEIESSILTVRIQDNENKTRITYFTAGRKRVGEARFATWAGMDSFFLVSLGQIVLKEAVETDKII